MVHRAVDLVQDSTFFTHLLKLKDELPIIYSTVQDYRTIYNSSVVEGALIIGTEYDIPEFDVNGISIT